MLTTYFLPTGNGQYTLWAPHDMKMGEIPDCEVVVLSPIELDGDLEEIKALIHDNLYRFAVVRQPPKRYAASFWFRMIWGFLALMAFTDPLDNLTWGLYLLVGLPVFANVVESIWKNRAQRVLAKFNEAVYWPDDLKVVVSPKLRGLCGIVKERGAVGALQSLYDLGLPELIGFYRRAAWSRRWTAGPPIGLGTFGKNNTEGESNEKD